jgi:hypothetical protein
VLLVVSGSSGSGKTTLARAVSSGIPRLVVNELGELADEPWRGQRGWRRDLTEQWVERAIVYEAEGRDLLLTEVVLGEVLAAPSATRLRGIAVFLLDCDDFERVRRIRERGGAEEPDSHQLWDVVAWGVWLRFHSADPQVFAGPIRGDDDGTWQWHRWERWRAGDPRWSVFRLDTTGEAVEQSAQRLADWIERSRRALARGELPLSGRWWDDPAADAPDDSWPSGP